MKKVILLSLLVLLFTIGSASAVSFSNSGGGDWKYYKEITIKENSGKTLTDYQVWKEDFDNYPVRTFPLGWGKIYSGRGWQYCMIDDSQAFSDPNSLRMEGLNGWSQVIGRQIPNPQDTSKVYDYSNGLPSDEYQKTVAWLKDHPKIWVEARVKTAEAKYEKAVARVSFYKVLPRWGQWYGGVSFMYNNSGYFIQAGGKAMPYEPYKWYKVLVYTDLTTRKATVWVNDKILAKNIPVEIKDWPEMVALFSDHAETKVWFDDVKFGYGTPSFISAEHTTTTPTPAPTRVYYEEDFETNPDYTSLAPEYAYWDSNQGNYYVKTFDNLAHKYWAYSPEFQTVDTNQDITIELDMKWEHPDWGTYPGVYFYHEHPETIEDIQNCVFWIRLQWDDARYKK